MEEKLKEGPVAVHKTRSARLHKGAQVRVRAKCFRLTLMKKNTAKTISENLGHCINMFISPYGLWSTCCVCLAEIKCSMAPELSFALTARANGA